MEQLNSVQLRGNVGATRIQTVGDSTVAHVSLATSRAYKAKDGSAMLDTVWHNVTIWSGKGVSAETLNAISKGTKLFVQGRLRNNHYTASDGSERYYTEIVANQIQLIEDETPLGCEL